MCIRCVWKSPSSKGRVISPRPPNALSAFRPPPRGVTLCFYCICIVLTLLGIPVHFCRGRRARQRCTGMHGKVDTINMQQKGGVTPWGGGRDALNAVGTLQTHRELKGRAMVIYHLQSTMGRQPPECLGTYCPLRGLLHTKCDNCKDDHTKEILIAKLSLDTQGHLKEW